MRIEMGTHAFRDGINALPLRQSTRGHVCMKLKTIVHPTVNKRHASVHSGSLENNPRVPTVVRGAGEFLRH